MNPLLYVLALGLAVAQFAVPSRLAFAPLLVAACTLPNVPIIKVGVSFTIVQLVILAGLLRAAGERRLVWSFHYPLDLLLLLWGCIAILSGFFHDPRDHNPITERLSLVYTIAGVYLYFRAFLSTHDDFLRLVKCLALLMVMLAGAMAFEKATLRNVSWTVATGTMVAPEVREGRVRAAGPFAHSILAGTAGATSLALLMPLLRRNRGLALAGIAATGAIVFCSASSGPFMALFATLAALALWRWRRHLHLIKTAVVLGIIGLSLAMNAPIWYLIARIDIVGGSTGFHRAELLNQAFQHLDRWWLVGTDYTRDWLPYAGWSDEQVDITNYYLRLGVTGGVPLALTFIAILFKAFQLLGRRMRELRSEGDPGEFVLWCSGAALFAHCVSFISVSYFDQSYVFYCLILGAVPGLCATPDEPLPVTAQTEADGEIFSERQEYVNTARI